jgi:regulator of PEP synthase PpsR (kinase-PPPase family)
VGAYASQSEVIGDLEHAREVFRRGRFATINVTAKPIEESAVDVVAAVTGH